MRPLLAEVENEAARLAYYKKVPPSGEGVWYADNSREGARDEGVRRGLIPLNALVVLPGVSTTSSKGRYALSAEFAALLDPGLTSEAFETKAAAWRAKYLSAAAPARAAVLQEPPTQPTIGQILDGYRRDRKADTERPLASPASLDHCIAALGRHLGDLTPEHLTRERCRLYARRCRAEGHEVGPPGRQRRKSVGDGTVLRELGVLRAALAWAVATRWITDAPQVEGPPTPAPRDRWLTREEARRLLAGCGDFHVRVFVALALHTAARTGAILDLTWDRVDLGRRRLDYGQGRGNKRRVRAVPIGDELLAVLARARELATSGHVVEFAGGRVGGVRTGFLAACRRAGLAGVTPHVLRHTAATWMAQAGVPMWEIAGMLGNSVEVVTRTYAKHSPEHLRRATGAIGGMPAGAGVRVRKPRAGRQSSPRGEVRPNGSGTAPGQDPEKNGAAGQD